MAGPNQPDEPAFDEASARLESIVEAFERAWQRGERPALANFLPSGGLAGLALLVELIHADLECRLKRGEPARVEQYVKDYPELARHTEAVCDLISAEWRIRRRWEPGLARSEYERRFPRYREVLSKFLASPAELSDATSPPPVKDPPAALQVSLAVTRGPHAGQSFHFTGHDTFLVGRSKQAHFRLPEKDEYFSRIHFLIEVNPPHCRLTDMGSTNGTYVNGQRAYSADLKDGDSIEGGQTVLRVGVHALVPRPSAGEEAASLPNTPPTALPDAPFPSLPGVTQLVPPGQYSLRCLVCAVPVPAPSVPPADQAVAAGIAPLCVACREDIRVQPQSVPGYCIVRELGRGGMGIVYLAYRRTDGLVVALKTILPATDAAPSQVERFLREAHILRQLEHLNIVAFRDMGTMAGQLYFVMDYVRGTDAAQLLKEQGPLPVRRAVELVCQLLEGLAYAHARGFVHRDVKPANLLITQERDREVARLADFGLARVYQASQLSGLTLLGQTGGTLAFMAPEQITNFRDARPPVDQYAAAATLYHLLTGRFTHDFPKESHKRVLMVLQDEPVPLRARRADVPERLAAVVQRALAKNAAARYSSAEELQRALRAAC